MRIVAGTLKGRRIDGPAWDGLRPTSDALRETLFNVLAGSLEGASVLDVFAGSGAVGIEAVSRGATRATFVDNDPRALALVKKNVARCGIDGACTIVRADFMASRGGRPLEGSFDFVFLDPPYEMPALESAIERGAAALAPGGRLVLEHSRRRALPDRVGGLARVRQLTAGDSALSFYTPEQAR